MLHSLAYSISSSSTSHFLTHCSYFDICSFFLPSKRGANKDWLCKSSVRSSRFTPYCPIASRLSFHPRSSNILFYDSFRWAHENLISFSFHRICFHPIWMDSTSLSLFLSTYLQMVIKFSVFFFLFGSRSEVKLKSLRYGLQKAF